MKILLVSNAFARVTNGPAKFAHHVLDVATWLPGHEVRVLSEDTDSPEAQAAITRGQAYGMPLQIPRWARPLGQLWRMRPYYRRALEIQQTYAWDVLVYINAFQGAYAVRQGQVPVLGMINDYILADATLGGALTKPGHARHWLFKIFERWVAHRMPLVLTNSQFLANILAKRYNLPKERLPVLYKTVDVAKFAYKPDRAWPTDVTQPWHILFVKTNYEVGGLPELCEALKLLPQYRFVLEVVGPTAPYHAHIQGLLAGANHVELLIPGSLPQAAVHEKLYAAHIFCVPSRQEALGIANMEAALAGTPIVSARTGGIPEVLDNGRAAFLAEARQPSSLARALEQCISDPAERANRQAHARRFVEDTFGKMRMLQQFVALGQEGAAAWANNR
jgi:glycosyltransferase involved in cell wall biosynthesis